MDPEKEDLKKGQKQDDKDVGNLLKRGKDLFNKKTNQFAMLLRKASPFIAAIPLILKIVIIIGIIAFITNAFTAIEDAYSASDTANAAATTVIKNEVILTNAERR